MSTKAKKVKINIMGKQYKIEKPIKDTLESMSKAIHSHEVALLTWVHKDYQGKISVAEKEIIRKSLLDYCMQIPEAENILKRMKELDAQVEKDIKDKENNNKSQNKDKESQGVEE